MSQVETSRIAQAALGLKLAGAGYTEIADVLGFTSDTEARRAVEGELAARSHDDAGRDMLRREASARIERLLRGVWAKATTATDPEHLQAVSKALALIDRHAKLNGLDMPQEVLVHQPTLTEIDAWVANLMANQMHVGVEEADVIQIEAEDVPPALR